MDRMEDSTYTCTQDQQLSQGEESIVTDEPATNTTNPQTADSTNPSTPNTTIASQPGDKLPETVEGRIAKATELKEEGNKLFKQHEWKKAIKKYHHVLMYVKGITDRPDKLIGFAIPNKTSKPTKEQERIAEELTVVVHNNIAACLIKVNDWEKAVHHTIKVLELRPGNSKALFRKGMSCLGLGRLDEAGELLRKAEMIDPKDSNIQKQLQLLQHKQQQYAKTEQKMYQAMFAQK